MMNEDATPDQIGAAVETVSGFLRLIESAPKSAKQVEAALHMTIAQNYMVEYLAHLSQGCEPKDAIEKTMKGELLIGSPTDN